MINDDDDNLEVKTSLNLVLYELYHLDSIADIKFDAKGASYYRRMPLEKRQRIKKALEWALENKAQKFNNSLPNLGHIDNDDIIHFLTVLKNGFEEFNVLEK